MPTTDHFGPYVFVPPGGMAVGGAYNVVWGPDSRFWDCTASVAGHPASLHSTNRLYAVWVSDVSMGVTAIAQINPPGVDIVHTIHATFGNSGEETIEDIHAFLTIVTP